MIRRFTVIAAPQRSPEWFQARAGRLCGSRAADMLRVNKDKRPAASRQNLLSELLLERLTGKPKKDGFKSDAMLQGIEREADALALYEALTGTLLTPTGFLAHDIHMAGCSLDGHVGAFEGIVEAKCPIEATHLEYLQSGTVPADYLCQITHNLWISGADWCDWISYNPDFPDEMQTKLVRINRDEAVIADYEQKALAFLAELDTKVAAVRTQFQLNAVLQEVVAL